MSEQQAERQPIEQAARGQKRRAWPSPDTLAALVLAAAVLWHLAPMYASPGAAQDVIGSDNYRSHDWLEVAKLDFYARKSLLEWGQLPLWNPLLAGGQPQFSHPSDGSMGPLIIPTLLLGEVLGMKVNIVLVALFGTLGLFFLLRRCLNIGVAAPGALGVVGVDISALAGCQPVSLSASTSPAWSWPGPGCCACG